MKKTILFFISLFSAASLASASDIFSYTATGSPGASPDGLDQNNNPVSVWTVTTTLGGTNGTGDSGEDGAGVYFGNPDGGGGIGGSSENSWQEYSYQNDGTGLGGSVDATNVFAGGPLTVGQTVSINFVMRGTDPASGGLPAGEVGVSLLNGADTAIKFYIYGGSPGYYLYTDAGSTAVDAGPMTYQYQQAFKIAFTITGDNTYLAVAGSDTWTGTFNGPITGIDVFNHAGGNASDVGYNNLTIAPELDINNVSPSDDAALFNVTNTLSFSINSPAASVNAGGVQLILNGVNVSSNLVLVGAGSENVGVTYTNLLLNQNYVGQITVTNQIGAVATAAVRFDTFSPDFYTWEAEDFDFNGGQFIDNPVISTNSPDSYYNTVGISNIDEYVPNYNPTNQPHLWRTNDQVSINLADETVRTQFTIAGIPDYIVGYFNPSNWLSYTRTFPAGTYNIYARLSNGNGGLANCSLDEVSAGEGTVDQTTTPLGIFQFNARGWNSFDFIPLTDKWGNKLAVTLNGQMTLRLTSGPLGGGVNVNFFMLAPGINTPPAITDVYPDGSQPFQGTNSLTFTVSSAISTISAGNIQVTLNGVNVSSQLTFAGSSTNWNVKLPISQGSYALAITATDDAGNSGTYNETFDNFNQNNMMVESEDYDFNGGQFIDNPVASATNYLEANSYFFFPENNENNIAVYGVDYSASNDIPDETFVYRLDGSAGTQPCSDFLRDKFINSGQVSDEPVGATNTDCNICYWSPGTWFNYTRTFPTNTYNIYGRLASATPYSGATMDLVTSGQGTSSQTTESLGSFSDANANGWQSWHWAPLMNDGTNVAVSLGGIETLKVTAPAGAAAGSLNANFYMFVPATIEAISVQLNASINANTFSIQFQTQSNFNYTVQYSDTLSPADWQTLTTVTGDGTTKTVTDSVGGSQRFYRVEAQ